MMRRKLTPRLKEEIKANYHRLKKSDFDGNALRYLQQVRAGHKGQKTLQRNRKAAEEKLVEKHVSKQGEKPSKGKKVKSFTIDGKKYVEGSFVYDLIVKSAANKNEPVAKFFKENEAELSKILKNYLIAEKKEIDDLRKLIRALPDSSKIISPVKRRAITRDYASLILHMLKKTMIELMSIYPYVFIEYAFDLDGNLHFNCPRPGEYKEMDGPELQEYIEDRYINITWIDHIDNA